MRSFTIHSRNREMLYVSSEENHFLGFLSLMPGVIMQYEYKKGLTDICRMTFEMAFVVLWKLWFKMYYDYD